MRGGLRSLSGGAAPPERAGENLALRYCPEVRTRYNRYTLVQFPSDLPVVWLAVSRRLPTGAR
jgi:hypothetical protein